MYSRKLHLFAFALILALLQPLTAFRLPDYNSDELTSRVETASLDTNGEPSPLLDKGRVLNLSVTSVNDNLRSKPTTLDWRKAEGPKERESFDFFKLMTEPVAVPDSLLHDLRLIGSMTDCVEYDSIDHAKISNLFMDGVGAAACEVVALIPTPVNFKVHDYVMYPKLALADRGQAHDEAFESMKSKAVAASTYYVLLGCQLNPETGISPKFKVALNLPSLNDTIEINAALKESIVNDVISAMEEASVGTFGAISISEAEVAGLEKLEEIIGDIINGSFNNKMSELLLKSLGFYEAKFGSGAPDFTRTAADSTNLVRDYAGLKIGGVALITAFESAASSLPYGISTGIVITDNQNYNLGSNNLFNTAINAFEKLMPQEVVIWFHYYAPTSGTKKMFYKIKVSKDLTKEKAENAFELGYEEYKTKVYQQNPQRPENRENFSSCPPGFVDFLGRWRMKPIVTDCIPTYAFNPPGCYAKDPNLLCDIDIGARQYIMGGMCGFIDGFLDGLGGLMDAAEGLVEFASHAPGTLFWTLDGIQVIVNKCVKEGVSWKSFKEGASEKWERDKAYIENLATTASQIMEALNDVDMLKKAFNMFYTTLKATVQEILFSNGPILAGYKAGEFLFEVVITYLTAGTVTGVKWISKLTQTSRKVFTNHLNGGFGGMGNLAKTAWNSTTASLQRAKCRIGFGCFIASTLVHTAAGTIPIKDLAPQTSLASISAENPNANAVNYVLAFSHEQDIAEEKVCENWLSFSQQNENNKEEITPETWKWVSLFMVGEDGSGNLRAHLLRPIWWFEQHAANQIGSKIWLNIPEMGISGIATVDGFASNHIDTRKGAFSSEPPYIYRPITGWFERDVREVWDYMFSTGETIGATPNHPFFSDARQDYIPVGELRIGERVKLIGENAVTLVAKTVRENGLERVYNLEIWGDHNFHVGVEGVLVHNNYGIIQSLIDGIHNATIAFHKPYKCEEYSKALRTYFKNNDVNVKTKRWQLTLNGKDQPFVIGFDMPNGSTINITNNGFHEFTIINDKIFDNNIFDGMPIDEFMKRIVIPPGYGVREIDIIE